MASNETCLAPIPADIAFLTGPTMLGICLNWGFMGVLVVQLYYYHITFPRDLVYLKILVYSLAVLDVLQTAMVTADAFHWFVFGFGNLSQLDNTFLNSWDVVLLDAVISLIVQSFYCWRIYLLRKSFIIPVFILLISLTQCGAGIATAVIAHQLGHLSLISTEVAEQTTWLVGSAVADICITAVLTWTLLRSRSRIHSSSFGIIKRLVTLTVETNAITTLTALIGLILFLAVPQHSTLVVPPTAIIGKLYTNCLIAVLNNRRLTSNGTIKNNPVSSHSASAQNFRTTVNPQLSVQAPEGGVKIQIVRNVDFRRDSDIELGDMHKDAASSHITTESLNK
ncbi:hypothetical protein M422DRAFT_39612 [Sphaerobolus stellatus SS14]|uniref:DUF6534 domain-containing protein n=1 Tax=Sphaerobolus stellatus (strain SS14) TaxID=990650 RepID=A0A0C9TNL2_SPHS4|nr:hypothetical protein M422DRAFT_39612 [Sphaerobolus stellatus SS14]